jgi:RNA polymerase sigma-70 factor (ECF subfamily)
MATEMDNDLALMRTDLLRFARLQLRDGSLAEDVVQETMLAALAGAERFAQRSSLKTWVFSILRNKIIDAIRGRSREVSLNEAFGDEADLGEVENASFAADGHWDPSVRPGVWADPEASLEQARFWVVFEACLENLPAKTGRVFMMREFLGFDTDEICKELGMTPSNCWVVLHRARLALRACLEQRWFAGA